jgi:cellulose synthase/poly-beta-1,6-N-acetylglucosamine synthase-like glycosyltransferase
MAQIIFWLAVVVIAYHHIGYPLLLREMAKRHRNSRRPVEARAAKPELPSIALIVPCHNEERVIATKIENLVALDYPRARLSVVLALDGCTDRTGVIAEAALAKCRDRLRCRIDEYPNNIGKVAVLNAQIGSSDADIVALSDASSLLEPDALMRAARHFVAPDVGVVCGSYCVVDRSNAGELAYWTYQSSLRAHEAVMAGPVGAHGAFYLFRRAAWSPLPANTINDDFVLPMRIVLAGYRAIYDDHIIATELDASGSTQDFRRRMRIGAGNFQQLLWLRSLGSPRRSALAFVFCSGKGLRAVIPFIIAIAFIASLVAAADNRLFAVIVAGETVAAILAIIGWFAPPIAALRPLKIFAYFLIGHVACGLGAAALIVGQSERLWSFSTRGRSATRQVPLAAESVFRSRVPDSSQ